MLRLRRAHTRSLFHISVPGTASFSCAWWSDFELSWSGWCWDYFDDASCLTGSHMTAVYGYFGWAVLYVPTAVEWSFVICSSYPCEHLLIAVLLRSSARTCPDYCKLCIQQRLLSLLILLTFTLITSWRRNCTSGGGFLSEPITQKTVIVSFKFVLTASGALLPLCSVELWLITLLLVIDGVDQPSIADHFAPNPWAQIVLWSTLVFFACIQSVFTLTQKQSVMCS